MNGKSYSLTADELPPSYENIPAPAKLVEEYAQPEPIYSTSTAVKDPNRNGQVGSEAVEPAKEASTGVVSLSTLFKYANGLDWLMMVFGTLGALVHGAGMPVMILVFGNMIDSFVDVGQFCQQCNDTDVDKIQVFNYTYSGLVQAVAAGYRIDTNGSSSCSAFSNSGAVPYFLKRLGYTCSNLIKSASVAIEFQNFLETNVSAELKINTSSCSGASLGQDRLLADMFMYALYYIAIACGVFVSAYLQVGLWSLAAHRQAHRIKLGFFRSILRQDMSWFDTSKPGELSTRLADDVDKIQDGIGDKLGTFFQFTAASIAGIVVSFSFGLGWKLTLVILACSPLLVVGAMIMSKVTSDMTSKEQKAYAHAGGVAEEVLSSIRTVAAFGGQKKESTRYAELLKDARDFGIKKGITTGAGLGYLFFVIFAAYALGFWYGTTLVIAGEITVGTMVVIFFCVITSAFSLGNAAPNISNLATARGAAFAVYQIIDRVPHINSESEAGERPQSIFGNIAFNDVHFNYPSRPDVKVLRGLTLQVRSGQTVALVGPSGCGKSTTVQLIQRFYDPLSGQVELDGQDIRKLNLRWLRRQIGIVSQEPVLFATTIAENIRYGRDGVTQQDIEKAAMEANAHEFITKLPLKYDTLVGERGAQLSGGQKQRIAIARALVNTPKILLLDEATSALDTESEALVQAALDKARKGRTTIVIAHRLSTVRTADIIVGIKDGVAVEAGTHDELMALGGIYHQLVVSQQNMHTKKKPEGETSGDETEDEYIECIPNEYAEIGEEAYGQIQRTQSAIRGSRKLNRALSASATSTGSGTDTEEVGKSNEAKKNNLPTVSFFDLLGWNSPEWYFIAVGCFFALINGGSQPAFAVVFSKILAVFRSCSNEEIRNEADLYSLLFIVIAIVTMVARLMQPLMFAYSGENLTLRLRARSFAAMVRQDIAWFDDPDNSTGALTTRLAKETASIQNATGVRLGSVFQAVSNMGTAIVIAFVYSWQLTLAMLAVVPVVGLASFLEMKIFRGGATKDKKTYEDVGKIATEAISNIRTVQSLSRELTFYKMFCAKLDPPHKKELKWSQGIGITYGFSQAIIFFAYAGLFYLGAYLIDQKEIDFEAMMITFSTVMFGAMAVGQATSYLPESGNALVAAGHIKALEAAVPQIDAYSVEGEKPADYNATVEFRDVHFHYPNRPTVKVLRGLSVSLSPGQTLALVGSSGCGKSTSVQLMERFYDVDGGHVILDGRDIRALNVAWLRSQVGIVSQEPVLFDCSIAKNIAYGNNACDDVPMADVIAAAKKANIHDFIASLPDGYETNVGSKGTQLSGGQKQRVAIARALLRNPKILLLDEATSALDTESERVVQEALDQARLGRTSIVIAHRLSTVQNADKIAVLRHGQVEETGTHDELVARKGFYYKLLTVQNQKPAT